MLLEEWIPAFAGMTDMVMGLSSTLFGDDPNFCVSGIGIPLVSRSFRH